MPSPPGHRRSPSKSSGRAVRVVNDEETGDPDLAKKSKTMVFKSMMSSTKLFVLVLLCMQNTLFTVLRRYSQGVLKEIYSKVRNVFFLCIITTAVVIINFFFSPNINSQIYMLVRSVACWRNHQVCLLCVQNHIRFGTR
jgi:hypothetical protein